MSNSQYESPSGLLKFLTQFSNIRKFFRTRRAIHQGIPLYSLSQDEIESRGFLGPWSLNLYESTVAALPAIIFLWFVDIFRPEPPLNEALRIANKFLNLFNPFVLPITFLLLSWVASRASLYSRDAHLVDKCRRAKYAYLYFDGAYGLWAQMSWVTVESILQTFYGGNYYGVLTDAISTISAKILGEIQPEGIAQVGVVGFLLSLLSFGLLIWNLQIACYGVAGRLFKVNGYSGEAPRLFRGKPKAGSGPWLRYQYRTLGFTGVILTGLGFIVGWVAGLLGALLANFV